MLLPVNHTASPETVNSASLLEIRTEAVAAGNSSSMEFSTALHVSFVSPKRPYLPRPLSAGKWALVTAVVLLSVPSASVAQGNASAWSDGERRLRKAAHCPGQVISRALRYGTLPARSVLECASHCRADQRCLSIVFDDDVKECFLGNETARQDCSNMEPGHGGLKHYETVSLGTSTLGAIRWRLYILTRMTS